MASSAAVSATDCGEAATGLAPLGVEAALLLALLFFEAPFCLAPPLPFCLCSTTTCGASRAEGLGAGVVVVGVVVEVPSEPAGGVLGVVVVVVLDGVVPVACVSWEPE